MVILKKTFKSKIYKNSAAKMYVNYFSNLLTNLRLFKNINFILQLKGSDLWSIVQDKNVAKDVNEFFELNQYKLLFILLYKMKKG